MDRPWYARGMRVLRQNKLVKVFNLQRLIFACKSHQDPDPKRRGRDEPKTKYDRDFSHDVGPCRGCSSDAGDPLVQAQQQFTDWGWPLPYEKVSDKSISYLKEKGWWPLKWAYQPPWMAEATIPWIIKKMDLANKRGLELEIVGLLAGPDINEGLASGKFPIGNGGNFPVTSLLDKKVNVKSAGIIWTPLDEHPILVHLDCKIYKPKGS